MQYRFMVVATGPLAVNPGSIHRWREPKGAHQRLVKPAY